VKRNADFTVLRTVNNFGSRNTERIRGRGARVQKLLDGDARLRSSREYGTGAGWELNCKSDPREGVISAGKGSERKTDRGKW